MAFQWKNLSKGLSKELARTVGLRVSFAADDLSAKFGELPTNAFVDALWTTLRERWLATRPVSRKQVIAELRKAGLGDTAIKIGSKAGQMEYLRSCRQSERLKGIVLTAFLVEGSQPMMAPSIMVMSQQDKDNLWESQPSEDLPADSTPSKEAGKDTYLPYPSCSGAVVYGCHNGAGEDYTLDKTLGFLIDHCQQEIPGLTECHKWMDGDGVAVLENAFAYIGISEQFGRTAVWACPKDPTDSEAISWTKSIKGKLKEGVLNSFGGTFTRSQMIRSSPMPKYSDRKNVCVGKRMTIGELREALMYMDENMEVRIGLDPDNPKQFAIGAVAMKFTRLMWGQPTSSEDDRMLFLAAGDALGRLPDSAACQFGWATRSTSLKEIQGEGN
jgi:hypothetical protein